MPTPASRQAKHRIPVSAFQVIAYLREAPSRVTSSVAKRSVLSHMLEAGTAIRVFEPQPRLATASRARDKDVLPSVVAVGVCDEREARGLLDQLHSDPFVADCYVAPPRHVLMRESGARSGSAALENASWALDAIKADNVSSDASAITIAVVDSGVDCEHPDLKMAIEDYVNCTPESARDNEGHGTHVCGIIAGRGTPPTGVRGVCNARLVVFKGLCSPYNAVAYYRALREATDRASIVNLSLGGSSFDRAEADIVKRAVRKGVTIVAAMGNDYENGNDLNYPAALPGVIAVGAVDKALRRADFSNSGEHIRLVAPGVDIWSTAPNYRTAIFKSRTIYASCDGTSMAAPFVAGAIALLVATAGPMKPRAVSSKLRTRPCTQQSGWTEELGDGILDVSLTLKRRTVRSRKSASTSEGAKSLKKPTRCKTE